MPNSLPPLTWFRAFECAARHLNFTAAAAELNLTQSAVSQHVRSLELRLGAVLFVRKPRGLALTDAGRRLLPFVTDAIGDLSAGAALFEPRRKEETLTVACSTSLAQLWLAPRLPRFLDLYPDLQLRLVSTLWADDFILAEADVEIRYGPRDLEKEAGARLLRDDRIFPACAPAVARGRVGGESGRAAWERLSVAPAIQTVGAADNWRSWCERLGLEPPREIARSVDSHALAVAFARAGLGVALVNGLIAEEDLGAGRLIAPTGLSAPAKDAYFVFQRGRSHAGGAAARFTAWLHAEIAAGAAGAPKAAGG